MPVPLGALSPAYAKLNEPEDAFLTGATRSLGRRLLGLNVMSGPVLAKATKSLKQGLLPKRAAAVPAQTQVA